MDKFVILQNRMFKVVKTYPDSAKSEEIARKWGEVLHKNGLLPADAIGPISHMTGIIVRMAHMGYE